MAEITVKHHGHGPGWQLTTVDATPCDVPGLAIHQSLPPHAGWAITHVRSGLAVALFGEDASQESVLAAAHALGELADWAQPGWVITAEVTLGEVDDAITPWGGRRAPGPQPRQGDLADVADVAGGAL